MSRYVRREPAKNESRKVLIACEGSETERAYFRGFQRVHRNSNAKVVVEHPKGTNPRRIVEFAIEMQQQIKREEDWGDEDSTWAMYDGVEHYRSDPGDWYRALDIAKANDIRLAISNPSFELWYLLHFQEQTGWLERDAAYKRLRDKWLPGYDKTNELYPTKLQPLTKTALERAERLTKYRAEHGFAMHEHLCVDGIAELVALLLELAKG